MHGLEGVAFDRSCSRVVTVVCLSGSVSLWLPDAVDVNSDSSVISSSDINSITVDRYPGNPVSNEQGSEDCKDVNKKTYHFVHEFVSFLYLV